MDTENTSSPTETVEPTGAFYKALVRKNNKIRADRAAAIYESAEMLYKRSVEDMELEIKKLRRERAGMLDLSPTTADSLVLASDFNEKEFVARDLELGLKIRNLEIKLEIAKKSYQELFN